MTDRYESERARRLVIVVGAEREIESVARAAYQDLSMNLASNLKLAPVVAAVTPSVLWEQLTKKITSVVGKLFRRRFLSTGARKIALAKALADFETRLAHNLERVPAEILADIHALQQLGATKEQILAELTPGFAEYESRESSFAERVARTSAIAAFNAGDAEGFAEVARERNTPDVTKRWLSSHDSRVRPTHVVADNDPDNQAVPFDGFFKVGGFDAQYPGDWTLPPEESVNCRCTVLYTDGNLEVMTPVVAATGDPAALGQPVVDPITGDNLPNGWRGPIAALDKPTGDKRMLMTPKDGVKTREYPLSLTANHVGDPTGYPTIGAVDRTWAKNGLLYGEGPFDLGGEAGRTAARQLHNGYQNTVSIDPDMVEAAVHSYDSTGKLIDTVQLSKEMAQQFAHSGTPFSDGNWYFAKSDDESTDSSSGSTADVADQILAFTNWRLAGLAHVPIPAYTEARIQPVYDYQRSEPQAGDAIISAINDHDHSLETVAKAGPDFSDHSMVALHPSRPHPFQVKGGLPAKDLHVTLAYLGKGIHPDVAAAGHKAAQAAALALHPDHQATVAGYGHLGNDPEKGPASVLFLNGLGVDAGRQAAMDTLNSGFLTRNDDVGPGQTGIPIQHAPYMAHMTLGYGLPADAGAHLVGKKFDLAGAAMHHGDQRTNYPRPNGAPIGVDEPHSVSAPVVYPSHGEAGDGDTIVAASNKKIDGKFSKRDVKFLEELHKHLSVHHTRLQISESYLNDPKANNTAVMDLAKTIIHNQTAELTDIDTLISASGQKAIVAAVGGQVFNHKFFGDPGFTEHTPLTIDEDGHVYGHVRQHGTCYQYGGGKGNGGFCLEPPDSACGYAKFEQHRAKLDNGETINVGALTFGDGHNSAGSLQASQRHYNDVATVAAKVNAGTDIFGVWVNGQVTDAYADHAYDLLLSPMSGHWEPDADNNGHLEMIAVHIVVTPGYTARTIVAGFDEAGQPNSLIITTYPTPQEEPEMSQAEIVAAVRAELARQKRAADLMAKIGSNPAPDAEAALYAIVSGAGGSVDLPVASTSTPWDGGAAGGRILDRATKGGKIDAAEAGKGFLWRDGDGSKRGDYKFPFADVQNGVLTIIPRGVSAAAGRLNQAQGVDTGALKSKICSLYAKIQKTDSSWPDCPLK